MLVGLADRQHDQIDGRLLLQQGQQPVCGSTVGGRAKFVLDAADRRINGRQRRVQIGLQPGERG